MSSFQFEKKNEEQKYFLFYMAVRAVRDNDFKWKKNKLVAE